jgi:mono/diheme cytochrome c family protein
MRTMRLLGFSAAAALVMSGCYLKHKDPYYVYAPDMHYSVALKAQEEGATRPIPEGAVSREGHSYALVSMEQAARNPNPVARTKSALLAGRDLFNSYCIVCHGKYGEGDGTVTSMPNWPRPLMPRPPSLQSEKIRDYKDGQIFHIISMGQNTMPSYAEKLNPEERWQVVHYIRALYRAKHPSADDLKKAEGVVEENI